MGQVKSSLPPSSDMMVGNAVDTMVASNATISPQTLIAKMIPQNRRFFTRFPSFLGISDRNDMMTDRQRHPLCRRHAKG